MEEHYRRNRIKLDNIKINLYSSMGEVYNSFKIGNIDLINTSNPNFQEYMVQLDLTRQNIQEDSLIF